MSSYFLDSSALLAHYRRESGFEKIQALLADESADIFLSAISVLELARRAASLGADAQAARGAALAYANLATEVLPVDTAIAIRAFELGSASATRLPLADALIAASALSSNSILVHRDAHFDALPPGYPAREALA